MRTMGTCSKCGADVQWRTTTNGRSMPLDVDPDNDRGNVLLDFLNRAHVFADRPAAIAFQDAGANGNEYLEMSQTYLPHFASCPANERAAQVDGERALAEARP